MSSDAATSTTITNGLRYCNLANPGTKKDRETIAQHDQEGSQEPDLTLSLSIELSKKDKRPKTLEEETVTDSKLALSLFTSSSSK